VETSLFFPKTPWCSHSAKNFSEVVQFLTWTRKKKNLPSHFFKSLGLEWEVCAPLPVITFIAEKKMLTIWHIQTLLNAECCVELYCLGDMPEWDHLRTLNLSQNKMDEREASLIAQGRWEELNSLELSYNEIGESGFVPFVATAGWKSLQSINIHGIEI
jgi:hypothetical protein